MRHAIRNLRQPRKRQSHPRLRRPPMSSSDDSSTYKGSCHCGKISYTATISPPLESGHEVVSCNCSICARNGYLFVYLKNDAIKFHSGEGETTV